MTQHINITIKGRVQGVWFRATTKQKALEFGIKGYVKNLLNQNVFIEAEGNPDQLQQFLVWCKNGPPLAHVEEVVTKDNIIQHYTTFEIR